MPQSLESISGLFISAVHVLWWNESTDGRAAGRHQSHEDPRVVAAGRLFH